MQAIRSTGEDCLRFCNNISQCKVQPVHDFVKKQIQDVEAKLCIALGEIDRLYSRNDDYTSLNYAIYGEVYEAFEQIEDALSEVDQFIHGSSMDLVEPTAMRAELQSPLLLSGLVAEAFVGTPTMEQTIGTIEDNIGQIFLLTDLAEKEGHLLDHINEENVSNSPKELLPITFPLGGPLVYDKIVPELEVQAKQTSDTASETLETKSMGDVSPEASPRSNPPSIGSSSRSSMLRIAVAGTGGLARLIAHYIDDDTSHHVVLLSRTAQPQLTAGGYQVSVVDYNDIESLKYALRGIDIVISTVTGPNQIELIKAAVSVRVRRFAPAEFEGLPQLRAANDPLDRSRHLALQWLSHYAQYIQSTTFVCGILYERFQPGGLHQSQIGMSSGLSSQGAYIMDCGRMSAQVPAYDEANNPNVSICVTAAQDVARFVCKAIDLRQWPAEMRMSGERMLVKDLVALVQKLKGRMFDPIRWHGSASLRSELESAVAKQDSQEAAQLHALIATAEGRYDFTDPNLNRAFPDVRPISFGDWFVAKWKDPE